jgi:hypothetical protein
MEGCLRDKAGGAEQLQQVPSSGQSRPSALILLGHTDCSASWAGEPLAAEHLVDNIDQRPP